MAKKVSIEDLSNEINKALEEFKDTTEESLQKAIDKTAKDALERLKNANPSGSGHYGSWKEYNNSWKIMKTKTDKRNHKSSTIHNEKLYRLTHLLEKGHALVAGGRTIGKTSEFPHIEEVNDKAQEEFIENVVKGI